MCTPKMRFFARRPIAPLNEFVANLWISTGYRPAHRLERLLPNGIIELVIPLQESEPLRCYHPETFAPRNTFRGPILSGARAGHTVIDTAQLHEIMGACFHPGGAVALLGMPADDVRDHDVPLDALWGADAIALHDRLLAEKTPQGRLDLLEKALLQRARVDLRIHPVMRTALRQLDQTDTPVEVGDLAARFGWSDRHFIRSFSEQVGITPKAYGRIRRFQAALRRIRTGRPNNWADVAAECGYYDQAHLIRDFRAFSGLTPAAYARIGRNEIQGVPIVEEKDPEKECRQCASAR